MSTTEVALTAHIVMPWPDCAAAFFSGLKSSSSASASDTRRYRSTPRRVRTVAERGGGAMTRMLELGRLARAALFAESTFDYFEATVATSSGMARPAAL